MNLIRVAIVDDLQLIRETFRNLLDKHPAIKVVAEAGSGQAGIEMVELHSPDVVLMDSSMPGLDGYEATKIIAARFPDTKAIILTMWDTKEHREQALTAGAAGFITKDSDPRELIDLIQSVVSELS